MGRSARVYLAVVVLALVLALAAPVSAAPWSGFLPAEFQQIFGPALFDPGAVAAGRDLSGLNLLLEAFAAAQEPQYTDHVGQIQFAFYLEEPSLRQWGILRATIRMWTRGDDALIEVEFRLSGSMPSEQGSLQLMTRDGQSYLKYGDEPWLYLGSGGHDFALLPVGAVDNSGMALYDLPREAIMAFVHMSPLVRRLAAVEGTTGAPVRIEAVLDGRVVADLIRALLQEIGADADVRLRIHDIDMYWLVNPADYTFRGSGLLLAAAMQDPGAGMRFDFSLNATDTRVPAAGPAPFDRLDPADVDYSLGAPSED